MHRPDARLASIAARQRSLFTTAQAARCGITADMLFDRTRAGLVRLVHPNVYVHTAATFTTETRMHAAVLACGADSFLSHRAGSAWLGFPSARRFKPEVTTPHLDLPRIPGIDVHRTRRFHPRDVVVVDGVRVSSPGRTALDLCAVLPYAAAEALITEAVVCKKLSLPQLLAAIERRGGRGVSGTVACREIAAGAFDLEGIQSMLELDLARIIAAADVPPPVRQYELVCADGRVVVLDNAWPELKIAAEGDGMRWHATPARLRKTRARSRSIQGSSWEHLVYGWDDAHETPLEVRREIEWHVAERSRLAS